MLKSPPTTGDIRLLRILSLTVLMVQWTAAEDELSGLEGDYHTHPFKADRKPIHFNPKITQDETKFIYQKLIS